MTNEIIKLSESWSQVKIRRYLKMNIYLPALVNLTAKDICPGELSDHSIMQTFV